MLIMTSGLMLTYEAYVSLGRIEEFLLLENLLEASESGRVVKATSPNKKEKLPKVSKVAFTWKKSGKYGESFPLSWSNRIRAY